jgi:hypothetical protein
MVTARTTTSKVAHSASCTISPYRKQSMVTNRTDAKGSTKTKNTKKEENNETTTNNKTWNDMSHLSIKRFSDDDPILKPGAIRSRTIQYPYVACAEIDPSGRAACKLCGNVIPKNTVRLSLMMECHKGYRMPCTLHKDCFFQHPESLKLSTMNEIHIKDKKRIDGKQFEQLQEAFDRMKQQQQKEPKNKR